MSNMRSYGTARSLFGFLELVAWSAVVIGMLAAFAGADTRSGGMFGGNIGIIGAVPGIIITVLGLFQVAIVQAARATVDTAEYTQQMLKIARDQLDVSKQSLKQGERIETGFSALKQPEPTRAKASFADRIEKPKRKKKKKKSKAPIEAIAAASAVELGVETTETITPEPLQLEGAQPLSLPEIPVDPPEELAPEFVAVEEAILEPEPEALPEPIPEPEPQSFEYNGRTIEQVGHKFFYNGIEFISLDVAQKYIDNFATTPAKKLPGASRST